MTPHFAISSATSVLLIINVLAGLLVTGLIVLAKSKDEEAPAIETASAMPDMLEVARRHAPDLGDRVTTALASIAGLRAAVATADDQTTADALALADRRLPSLMAHHEQAMAGANAAERDAIARRTLEGLIDAGRVCEEARAHAVGRRRDLVDTEARYMASRAADCSTAVAA